jgi:membrane protein
MPAIARMMRLALIAWKRDKVPRLGAALAYYTLFALAPVLLVVISIAGLVWGQEAVQGRIVGEIDQLVGAEGARVIQDMVRAAARPRESRVATIIGAITLIIAVSGAFLELQAVLNFIWRVKVKPQNALKRFFSNRLQSFGLVLSIGLILLISMAGSAALAAVSDWLGQRLPLFAGFWLAVHEVFALAAVTVLFAMIYRFLPDVRLRWKNVWLGAFVTALLFTIGKMLIGLYLSRTNTAVTYGTASAVAIILIWVYYTTQIVLLGAEYTRVRTRSRHSVAKPKPFAEDRSHTEAGGSRKEAH